MTSSPRAKHLISSNASSILSNWVRNRPLIASLITNTILEAQLVHHLLENSHPLSLVFSLKQQRNLTPCLPQAFSKSKHERHTRQKGLKISKSLQASRLKPHKKRIVLLLNHRPLRQWTSPAALDATVLSALMAPSQLWLLSVLASTPITANVAPKRSDILNEGSEEWTIFYPNMSACKAVKELESLRLGCSDALRDDDTQRHL